MCKMSNLTRRRWVVAYDEADGDLVKLRAKLMSANADGENGDDDRKGKAKDDPAVEEEEWTECGCCFTEYSFVSGLSFEPFLCH